MALVEYRRKRHFKRTPEPAGVVSASAGHSFVVQKHAASHLHYDFRLELDGVLKSWAVPKGPSLDPGVKRLAMEVEDHPVAYGSFEGVIPEGEYGGGTVLLWDRGTWEPIGDPREGLRRQAQVRAARQKVRGRWMLVRTGADGERRRWLLFKERDAEARPADEGDILEEEPLSISSGRDLDAIASSRDRVWSSRPETNGKAHTARAPERTAARPKRRAVAKLAVTKLPGAAAAKMPARIDVQLATLVKEAPVGDEWLHEIKFDGYRMICRIDDGQADLITRNHKNWTSRLAVLAEAARRLPVRQAIVDGEVVALRADGTSDFQELQNAFRDGRAETLQYYAFDLLYLDGYDLTQVPLAERKRLLSEIVASAEVPNIHFSEHVEGSGAAFLDQACKMRLEGIISKRRDRPYRPGRGYDWVKVKCLQTGEFVIGGYSEPSGTRTGFGRLLVGFHDDKGELVYAGKVGTGFDQRTLRDLVEKLRSLERQNSPFSTLRRKGAGTHWVEPSLVAQIAFGSWTRDRLLRHASFQGLREDKSAAEVTREKPVPLAQVRRRRHVKGGATMSPAKTADVNGYDERKKQFAGVRLTSPDKGLYPEQGITKLELASYYRSVADWILPHLHDRPLVLVRCPEGREKACFYQKHPVAGTPDALRQIPVEESKATRNYVVVDDVAGLIALAQIGTLEVHAWGSRADRLEYPDRLIFDLDPDPQVPWSRVVQGAVQVRDFLEELGLRSFVKTTGGKGLHLVVPIDRRHDWDDAKSFCKMVADLIVAADPTHYTANMSKAARTRKIFVDYLRNGRGATAVAPYSTRARPNAPVSTPLAWSELSARIPSDHYTVRNLARRLTALKRDPWEELASLRQSLTKPLRKVESLTR